MQIVQINLTLFASWENDQILCVLSGIWFDLWVVLSLLFVLLLLWGMKVIEHKREEGGEGVFGITLHICSAE